MEILLKDYNSVTELMFTDLELRTIIAMTKSYDEEYPALKRIIRKCEKTRTTFYGRIKKF